MSPHHIWYSRALASAGVAAVLGAGALAGAIPASAHVHVDADGAVRGESTLLTFRVPNESDTGSPTTGLRVDLPDLTSVSTAVTPGWTAQLDRDVAAGTVRAVTWAAQPGGGIGADQFGLFVMRVKLPDTGTVSFPATQTYADGTVVRWDQPLAPDGSEPEHPAPTLELAPATGDSGHGDHGDHGGPALQREAPPANPAPAGASDNTARALAGGALLLAGLAVGVGLARRRS